MTIHLRGFGNDHQNEGSSSHNMTGEDQYEHIASILSIVITGLTVVGAIFIVTRTVKVIRKSKNKSKSHGKRKASGSEEEEEDVGGAKRMRGMLLIGLLIADVWVGISWLAPAVMGLRDRPLRGDQCQAPGFTLATALWWQYGFSIAIASSTYFAVRHPLSTIKRLQEKYTKAIICLVIVTGLLQATLWDRLHGYTDWGQFCYYGSPRSRISEIMQFLPRLLSSFVIAIVYVFLIRFLCRPDLTAQYSVPVPANNQSAITLCGDGNGDGKTIPPWEKMVLPDFSRLLGDEQEKLEMKKLGHGSPRMRGLTMSKHFRSISANSTLTIPDKAWLGHASIRIDIGAITTPYPPYIPGSYLR